ncbi:MAG: LUD domain-containing protein [Armatimonadetes bacterium]|nr:LUD domain-containing protein [Armatimonadota bacterium]
MDKEETREKKGKGCSPLDLRQAIRQALANQNLGGALGRFADAYLPSREKVFEGRDFAALREEIRRVKQSTIDYMDALAERFTENARKRGAVVFPAPDAQAACAYILELARKNSVDFVVKSKSMASEEIHLNKYLEKAGITVAETDLGEWIIQLCGQKPSHMVMPAIHLTRQEVAEIFSHEIKERLESDIPRLVKVAREQLRQKFLTAQMGISGANVAVAETGTLFIMTNEGNARLVTTLPPIHVVIVGLEKLVEKLSDAGPIFEALPRCATAQHLTSYLSLITGPAQVENIEGETGAKELHIVLLDNGRRKMAADPRFRDALRCIRCASCLNVCPVFALIGGHVFGHIYTGGIGTILTAFFGPGREAEDLQTLCLGCQRCREYCPAGIDIPQMILDLRERYAGGRLLPRGQKLFMEKVMPNRKLFHTILKTAARVQKPVTKGRPLVRHLPLFGRGLTEGRSLPALADRALRDRLGAGETAAGQIGGQTIRPAGEPVQKAGFFAGCLIDFVYPEIGEAVLDTLVCLGYAPVFPPAQNCCGFPLEHSGFREAAVELAKQNIAAFAGAGVSVVVTACPTCAVSLKKSYPRLLGDDPAWAKQAADLAAKVVDYASFALHQLADRQIEGTPFGPVTYHDSCHLKRSLGVYREPRELLVRAGAQLQEMAWSDRCCGFGGSYSIQFPELSRPILEQKIANIAASGARMVAMDCPGCLLQIRGGLDYRDLPVKAEHTASIIGDILKRKFS